MASRIMHLAIAKKVSQVFDVDLEGFMFGNLLPDITKNIVEKKRISHFRVKGNTYSDDVFYDYEGYFAKYKEDIMQSDVYLGYYSHLIADDWWVRSYYAKYLVDATGNRIKDPGKIKKYYEDFFSSNKYIIEKYDLSDQLTPCMVTIEEIDGDHVDEFWDLLSDDFHLSPSQASLQMMTYDDIDQHIDEATSLILKKFKCNDSCKHKFFVKAY